MPYIGNNHIAGDHTNNFKVLDDISSYTATFDGSATSVVDTTNNTIRVVEHRFIQGQRVTYTNGGGGNIGGLTTGTAYFVIFDSASTIKLATSASNAANSTAINLSAVGSGTSHTLNAAFDGVNTKFKLTHGSGTGARLNNATQINVAINNVLQRPNLDPNNFTDGFALEDNHKIVFQTSPTSEDIFWGSIIANTLTTFDISDHKIDTFTGDGSTTEFTLSHTPANNESLMVTINGVLQHPSNASTARAYTLIASIIQFTAAPGVGDEIQVRHLGFAGATTADVSGFYGRTGNVVLTSNDHITTGNINAGIVTATSFDGTFSSSVGGSNANFTGIVTAGVFKGGDFDGRNLNISGIATFAGDVSIGGTLTYEDVTNIDSVGIITARSDLNVDGHTNLDNVNVAGVSTFTGNIDANGDLDVDGTTNLDHVFVSQHLRVLSGGGLQVTGITTSQAFRATGGTVSITDGGVTDTVSNAALVMDEGTRIYTKESHNGYMRNLIGKINDVISIGSSNTGFIDEINLFPGNSGPVQLFHGTNSTIPKFKTTSTGIEIVGKTDTDTLLVSGASDLNGDLDVDGHTNLDNVSIAGVTTFSNNVKFDGATAGRDVTFIRSSNTLEFATNAILELGNGGSGDCRLFNNGTDTRIINGDGTLKFESDTYEFKDKDNTTSYLNITSAGDIGIGYNSPTVKLHIREAASGYSGTYDNRYHCIIEDDAEAYYGMYVPDNGYAGIRFHRASGGASATSAVGYIDCYMSNEEMHYYCRGSGTTGKHIFSTGGSERLRIDENGINATGNIDSTVAGGNNQLKIETTSSGDPSIYFAASGSGGHNIEYIRSSNTLNFKQAGGSVRLSITAAGHLLPGTDSQYNIGSNTVRFANIYADTLYGDGSNLTGISGVTINNNADNRIITGSGTANTLNGESGLTFNGTDLVMNTSGGRIYTTRTSGEAGILIGSGNAGGATIYLDGDSNGDWSGGDYAYIRHNTSGHLDLHSTNPNDDGRIRFYTGADTYAGQISADGVFSVYAATHPRGFEINIGTGGGSLVLDRDGNITSLIRASDGGSNVGGGSGGGSRISLGKTQMHFRTYPYVTNAGDQPTYTTRASIDTSGNFVPGANNTYNLGSTSLRWANLYINDLQLSNEAKKDEGGNDVDGTWGDWTLQEGENKIFMINNRTGKKYSLKMEEE